MVAIVAGAPTETPPLFTSAANSSGLVLPHGKTAFRAINCDDAAIADFISRARSGDPSVRRVA